LDHKQVLAESYISYNYKHEFGWCGVVFLHTLQNVNSLRCIKLVYLAILFIIFVNPAFANIAELCNVPKKLTFTSIDHPKVRSEIQPLISHVYKKLGIDVEYLITASGRDLKLISEGQVLGGAVYSEDVIDNLAGAINIHPPLVKVSNMLLCNKEVVCRESILSNATLDKPIAVSRALSSAFLKRYSDFDKNNLLIVSEMKKVIESIRSGRVAYGIYPISDHTIGGLEEIPFDLNSDFLYSVSSFHIISSELQCLEPMVEQVLADTLLSPQGWF